MKRPLKDTAKNLAVAIVAGLCLPLFTPLISDVALAEKPAQTAPESYAQVQTSIPADAPGSKPVYKSGHDLIGRKVATMTGGICLDIFRAAGMPFEGVYYNNLADCVLALRQNKAEAVCSSDIVMYTGYGNQADLALLPSVQFMPASFAVSKGNEPLAQQIDEEIRKLRASGELEKLQKKWFTPGSAGKTMPQFAELPPDAPVWRGAIVSDREPFTYMANGQHTGYEVEVIMRIAHILGAKLELSEVNFNGLLASVTSGRADIAIGDISITPERARKVRFTEPTANNGITLLLRSENAAAPTKAPAEMPPVSGKAIYKSIFDFTGVKLGVTTGSSYTEMLKAAGIQPEMVYYNSGFDAGIALRQGKVEGLVNDDVMLRMNYGNQPGLTILPALKPVPTAFVFKKDNRALADRVNAQINKLKTSGELQRLQDKWFAPDKAGTPLSLLTDLPPDAPVLRVAAAADQMPFIYIQEGHFIGYEAEVLVRVAQALGMRLELTSVDFGGLLPMVTSGRADIAAGCISITPERMESVLFSEPTSQTGMTVLIRTENAEKLVSPGADSAAGKTQSAPQELSFWQDLQRSFERNLIVENRWRMILSGLWATIVISLGSLVLGTAMGVGLCALRRSKHSVPQSAARVYIRILQGTPIVVLLMIFYYILLTDVPLSGTSVAILAFSCNFAAYVSEMFRTSMDALDKGQQEAAVALGFTPWQKFRHIVMPQAARITLPVFKGEFVSMVKMTSVVGYIAVQDLTKVSDLIRSRTYEPFFPLILTAVIYFCIAYVCIIPLNKLEARIDPTQRKRSLAGIDANQDLPAGQSSTRSLA